VSEWIAPATHSVVVMTISELPAGARMTASPRTGRSGEAQPASHIPQARDKSLV
jgi:hypothetical protein